MFTSDVRVAAGVAVSAMCRSLLSLSQVADFGFHVLVQQDVGAVRQKRDVDNTSFSKESSSTRCQLFHLARRVRLPFTILHPGKKKILLPCAATLQRFFFFKSLGHTFVGREDTHPLCDCHLDINQSSCTSAGRTHNVKNLQVSSHKVMLLIKRWSCSSCETSKR